MIIGPSISLNKEQYTIEGLQMLAEEMYEKMAVESRKARKEKGKVVKVVDLLLIMKSPDMIFQLKRIVFSDLFQYIKKYDDEFVTFEKVLSIYEEEKNAGKTSLLERVTSVVELQEVWVKTFFGMRRLEMSMPRESHVGFMQLIRRYDMSAIYLINVWKWHPFYNLNFIAQQLIILLYENGMNDLCEEIYEQIEALDKQGE